MSMSLKSYVQYRLDEIGRTPAEATTIGGLSRTFVYDLLSGPDSRNVTGENFAKLAKGLGLTVQQLLAALESDEPLSDAPAPTAPSDVRLIDLKTPYTDSMPRDVPVLGTAQGSVFENVEGFVFEGEAIDYARRPPALTMIKGLYALYIINDSMYPMHPAGEIRFVNPNKPPQIGGSVIVQTRRHDGDPGQAYIKILRKRTPTKLVLEQFNPPATIEIPMEYVRSVHHVYTMNEMFGL